MRGCLTLPFRLLLLAIIAVALLLGWTYREELRRRVHAWTAEPPSRPAAEGWADPASLPAVRQRLARLRDTRDTIVLTAAELASLVAGELDRKIPGAVDSLHARLGRDEVALLAFVETSRVPLALGPAAPVLREREWIEVGGRLSYRRAGLAEWEIRRARVRGIPVPRTVLAGLLRQLSGAAPAGVAEIPLPGSIGGLRAGPAGLVLYGPNPHAR